MLAEEHVSALDTICEATLRRNWREGIRHADRTQFAYTCPSPGHYPWQFYWDSCFAAIARRRFDPVRPQMELASLLGSQREDGFIGHTIFWETPLTGPRRFTYNVTSQDAMMTSSIQPPGLAWAWRIAVGDPAAEPGILRQHEWLEANRDLDGDGLLWLVQPDESGLDASPQFDPIWRLRAHSLPGYVGLVHRNRRLGYDMRRIADAGGPVVCEILTNVVYSLSRMALGKSSLTETLIERCYDEESGLFWPRVKPHPPVRIPLTWSALAPLALPDLPETIGRRLIEEYLLDRSKFWLPVAPPSVAASDPKFQRGDLLFPGVRRYWRGPTWINAAWFMWLGLNRLGYTEAAERMTRNLASVVRVEGLREYYDPFTGRGMGATEFAWSSLIMELVSPDPRAASSYLD
jgi:Mannosylglycerate hydrolase MGH1-like glycoside hydrolase domain